MIWEVLAVVFAVLLILYFAISFLIFKKAIRTESFPSEGLVDQGSDFFSSSWEWFQNVPRETVRIHAYDHVVLSAVYIPSFEQKSTNTAILCHGYRGANTDMVVIAKMYSDLGFRILIPDARGHGLSKGKFTSFGHFESYDLRRWVQYLLRTYGATDSILLHGVSMGAATVILSSGRGLPENVKALVADSPFTNALSVLSRGMKPRFLAFFVPGVSLLCRYLHRFFLGQADVVRVAKKTHTPLFIFHGEKDLVCPFEGSKRLLKASGASEKQLYGIPNADHAEGYIRDTAGVQHAILDFLQKSFTLSKTVIPKKNK